MLTELHTCVHSYLHTYVEEMGFRKRSSTCKKAKAKLCGVHGKLNLSKSLRLPPASLDSTRLNLHVAIIRPSPPAADCPLVRVRVSSIQCHTSECIFTNIS